jgi:hypothetical protein
MIDICNLRHNKPKYEYDFKVDRSSILGNPFILGKDGDRDTVCELYKQYFKEKILSKDKKFGNELEKLIEAYSTHKKLRLFCWCSPKRCHAETIKELIEKYVLITELRK